jgi:CDP-paratose 2-epimerase
MNIALITGSAGLIGSEAVRFFAKKGFNVIGIDNDLRRFFFGEEASTMWNLETLEKEVPGYLHYSTDIRDLPGIKKIFQEYGSEIKVIIHTAAQPSHDWAASDPLTDFAVNSNGTLNLLEMMRQFCSQAVFIFTSTNNVYGDTSNRLPLVEKETRWEVDESHSYYPYGIDETMSIDTTQHTIFGASKLAADVMVQEYGRYFDLYTGIFRAGCLTGPAHSGTMLHGFLSYLMKCAVTGNRYTVFGYKGKQVRDNIHSYDLVNMFWHFYQNPRKGEVYNVGGSRFSHCSMLEAIETCNEITGNRVNWTYSEKNRRGDHIWWISDIRKFQNHYPAWQYKYGLKEIFQQIYRNAPPDF